MTEERGQYLSYYCASKKCDDRNGSECDNCMYEKGYADAINECIKIQLDMSCVESCHRTDCTECMVEQMEQLKEQK